MVCVTNIYSPLFCKNAWQMRQYQQRTDLCLITLATHQSILHSLGYQIPVRRTECLENNDLTQNIRNLAKTTKVIYKPVGEYPIGLFEQIQDNIDTIKVIGFLRTLDIKPTLDAIKAKYDYIDVDEQFTYDFIEQRATQ